MLENYVDCVRQFYPNGNIDILTHSMGSLLARRFILDHPNAHHINKLITIGAPWLGAPKAINVMETGDFGISQFVILKSTIKRIVEFFPGVHELAPSRSYFTLGGLPFTEAGWDINDDGRSMDNYTVDQLIDLLARRFPHSTSVLPFSTPGTNARVFHDSPGQDDWRFDQSGVQYYHIFGRKSQR